MSNSKSSRRDFFHKSGTAVLATSMLSAGTAIASGASETEFESNDLLARSNEIPFRIRELNLLTSCDLQTMKQFYDEVLELEIQKATDELLSIKAGVSVINFHLSKDSENPFYHFAFNIPENKISKAREWMVERTELIDSPAHLVDSDFPQDVWYYRNWDAHSIYFWDPAGNVLECIARHTLDNAETGEFGGRDMHCVSEIALVVDDVSEYADSLKQQFQLDSYKTSSAEFHAVGDEAGLLLVFRKGRFTTAAKREPKEWDVFPTEVFVKPEIKVVKDGLPHKVRT